MVFSKMLGLSLLALVPIAFAIPTPETVVATVASSTEPIDWMPVDFEGKTIYVNSAAVADASVNPVTKASRSLSRRITYDDNMCGPSTFNPHPGPYPTTGDCGVIRDWAFTQRGSWWQVKELTPDTHGLWYYGSCVFEVGTQNFWLTYIGSTDVGDVARDAINIFQYNGFIASQGVMGCENTQGTSSVNWKIKHS